MGTRHRHCDYAQVTVNASGLRGRARCKDGLSICERGFNITAVGTRQLLQGAGNSSLGALARKHTFDLS
jgi:hypothetical protein